MLTLLLSFPAQVSGDDDDDRDPDDGGDVDMTGGDASALGADSEDHEADDFGEHEQSELAAAMQSFAGSPSGDDSGAELLEYGAPLFLVTFPSFLTLF